VRTGREREDENDDGSEGSSHIFSDTRVEK
jgi:hypothetical protein